MCSMLFDEVDVFHLFVSSPIANEIQMVATTAAVCSKIIGRDREAYLQLRRTIPT